MTWYAWSRGTQKTAAAKPLTLHDIDTYVGAFPGVGACVEHSPSEQAKGYHERLPIGQVEYWSRGDLRLHPRDESEEHDLAYTQDMAKDLTAGKSLDPIVAYHRPEGHPDRSEEWPDKKDYEVEDGEHRISAHLMAKQPTINALVFHDRGCCSKASGAQKTAAADEEWYHGSAQMAPFDRFDHTKDPRKDLVDTGPKHWNCHLGSHFTSDHQTAASLAFDHSGTVYHVGLAMKNPKHYYSEKDMDREAHGWARDRGEFANDILGGDWSPANDLRYHPKVAEIAKGFKEHLKAQGHDGITYGNEWEGPHLHECAIAFHPDDITIHSVHHSAEPCQDGAVCKECLYPHDETAWGNCHHCGHDLAEDVPKTSLLQHFAAFLPDRKTLPIEQVLGMESGDYDTPTKVRDVVERLREHHGPKGWDAPRNTRPVHILVPAPGSGDPHYLVNGHHRVTRAVVLGHPTIDAVVHHPHVDRDGDWDWPTYFDQPNFHTAARNPIYRFAPETPEGTHSIYRGLYLGGDTKAKHVPDDGIGHLEDTPADHSDQGILDDLAQHHQWRLDKDLIVGPEHPAHDRLPMYGSHWTQDPHLARQFALDGSHGRYRAPGPPKRTTTGVVLEAQTAEPPEHDSLGSQFGESEAKWPGRDKITRVLAHVHRYDPDESPDFYRTDTHVRTFEIPPEHLAKHSAKYPFYEVGDPEEFHSEHPGSEQRVHMTNYTEADKVHPSVFGMQIREWHPHRSERVSPPQKITVPLHKVWGTQDYVYAPHVRNLATVPAHEMEPVEGQAMIDGTYQSDDHHRVAAAHLRGDKTISMVVGSREVQQKQSAAKIWECSRCAQQTQTQRMPTSWRQLSSGEILCSPCHGEVTKTAMGSGEETGDPTNWDYHYPHLPETLHRGMALTHPETLRVLRDPSASSETKAKAIAAHISGQPLGTHYTSELSEAQDFADYQAHEYGGEGGARRRDSEGVVLHVAKPDRQHIETDRDRLEERGVYPYHVQDSEVPLRPGAPVHLTGVSWSEDGDPRHLTGHHDFPKPIRVQAAKAMTPRQKVKASKHAAADPVRTEELLDLIGGNRPKPASPADHANEPDEAERMRKIDEDWKAHVQKHQEWQAQRSGVSPGDDLSNGMEGYPHAQWVPIKVAQQFRDHHADQTQLDRAITDDITHQLRSGRGMTDPLMLLHHNEQSVAHLGEGNHRLKAAEHAGWTHVPMRVVRMYDGEVSDKGKPIPHDWVGSHQGRTPELCKPSDVLHSSLFEGHRKEAAKHPGPHYHGTRAQLSPGDLIEPNTHPPSHQPWGETEPRQHVYFSPRRSYVTEHYGPNVYEVEPTGDYTHDSEYDNRQMFKSTSPLRVVRQVNGTRKESALSLEDYISVAEHAMEEAGNAGKDWHLPQVHVDHPDHAAVHQPVNDYVNGVLRSEGWKGKPDGIRVHVSNWDLDHSRASAITDGLNYIGVRNHFKTGHLLHEVAHILHSSNEGEGHSQAFADTLERLYRTHVSDEAGDHFHAIVSKHPAYAGVDSQPTTKDSGEHADHEEGHLGRRAQGGPRLDRPSDGGQDARAFPRVRDRLRRFLGGADSGGDLRPLTWHRAATKEFKRLDKPAQKAVQTTLDALQRGDPNLQTHPLAGDLRGWYSTKASRGHRIVHQPTDDGGIYIGGVSLHEYPNQRLGALSKTWDLDPEHTTSTTRKVGDLPFPNVLESNPRDVAKIRRRLRNPNIGYVHDADAPITILRRKDGTEELIDGNHRTEALMTAGGFEDLEIPVLETTKDPRPNQRLGAKAGWSDWEEHVYPTGLVAHSRERDLGDGAVLRHDVSPSGGGLTVSHGDKIPGELHYRIQESPRADTGEHVPSLMVNWVEVDKKHRGKGWASAMYDALHEVHPGHVIPAADVLEPQGKRLVKHLREKHPDIHMGRFDTSGAIHPTSGPDDPLYRPEMLEPKDPGQQKTSAKQEQTWYHRGDDPRTYPHDGRWVHLGTRPAAAYRGDIYPHSGLYRVTVAPQHPANSPAGPAEDYDANRIDMWLGDGAHVNEAGEPHIPTKFISNSRDREDLARSLKNTGFRHGHHDALYYTNSVEDPGKVSMMVHPGAITHVEPIIEHQHPLFSRLIVH